MNINKAILTLAGALLLTMNAWGQTPLNWSRMKTEPKSLGLVEASVLFDDGQGEKLYVAGWFREMGDSPATNLARFDGVAWEGILAPVEGVIKTLGVFDEGNGARLFLGGEFVGRGVLAGSDFLARFDGTTFSSVGGAVDGHVRCFEVFDDGTGPALYVGGRFFTVGTLVSPMIARWDGSQWSSLDGGAAFPGSFSYGVFALSLFDVGTSQVLVAGGAFDRVGTPALSVNNLAAWDGANWTDLGLPNSVGVQLVEAIAMFDSGSGPELYVARTRGADAWSATNDRVLRFDGSVWSPLGVGIDPNVSTVIGDFSSRVHELCVFDDGSGMALHVGGFIGLAGGVSVNHWARFDGQAWNTPPGRVYSRGVGGGAIQSFLELPTALGGGVLVAGVFESTGNGARNSIARWTPAGVTDLGAASGALRYSGEGSGGLGRVASISDANGDGLLISGRFRELGGIATEGIARWDGTTLQDVAGAGLVFDEISVVRNGGSDELLALSRYGVLRRTGNNWVALGPYDALGSLWTSDGDIAYADHGAGPVLYASGQILSAPLTYDTQALYRLSGNAWTPLPAIPTIPQLAGAATPQVFEIRGLITWDDGSGEALYAFGIASLGGTGVTRFGVVSRWDGQAWQLLPPLQFPGAQVQGSQPETAAVYESASESALYFAAFFVGPVGPSGYGSYGLTRWTGTAWESVGPPLPVTQPRAMFMHDAGNGAELYLRGETSSGFGLWAISGATWRPVLETSAYRVLGMASFDDGGGADIYAAAELLARPDGRRTDVLSTSSAMDSRVGSTVGIPQPVLGVSVGGAAVATPRSLEIPLGQSFSLDLAQPLTTTAPAAYALALFGGPPPPNIFTAAGFGDLSIPLPPIMGSTWFASAATSIAALVAGTTAPWSFPVVGGIPFATTITLQGVIADDSATLGFSVTNALSLRFR